jgi:hypothetical protein
MMFKRGCAGLIILMIAGCGSGNDGPTSPTPQSTATRIVGLSGNLAFGAVTVGSRATSTITITNSGNATLTVTGLTGPGGYAASWTNGTIPAGGAQPVTVTFAPTAAVSYNGTLTVNGDQTAGTSSMQISGSGAVPRANIHLTSSTATFVCVTGLCSSLTFPVTNDGPGCATNVQVVTRAYGSDGNGIQLGVDIPMGLPGSSLATFVFRVGTSVTLQSIASFNDVRSAHTVFNSFITWTDVACP